MKTMKTRTFTLKKVALAMMIAAGTMTSVYAAVTGTTDTIQGAIPVLKSVGGVKHAVSFTTTGVDPLMPLTGDSVTMTYKYSDTDGDDDNSTSTVQWFYVPANGTGTPVAITPTNAKAPVGSANGGGTGEGTSVITIPDGAVGAIIKAVITEQSSTGDLNTGYTITYGNIAKTGEVAPGPDGGTDTGGGGETAIPDVPVGPGTGLIPEIRLAGGGPNLIGGTTKLKVGSTYEFKLFASDGTTDLTDTVNFKWGLRHTSATTTTPAPAGYFNDNATYTPPVNADAFALTGTLDGVQGYKVVVDYTPKP
ncbi:hypothetical protein [Budvicia aquatica]|uniref:Ornithine carbamoyltransferase n=1 Tax=Budvicia aquatica TaxID=82979 RepID=A0A2C6DNP2_9GAMM|nr:hypothetical protein [Budvicia aquatica]PHI30055.1 ornithine carbamoyltransferase [Budvicia aquatica]VFS49033.1 Uncharacterised protein [Budvicia aquatica]